MNNNIIQFQSTSNLPPEVDWTQCAFNTLWISSGVMWTQQTGLDAHSMRITVSMWAALKLEKADRTKSYLFETMEANKSWRKRGEGKWREDKKVRWTAAKTRRVFEMSRGTWGALIQQLVFFLPHATQPTMHALVPAPLHQHYSTTYACTPLGGYLHNILALFHTCSQRETMILAQLSKLL